MIEIDMDYKIKEDANIVAEDVIILTYNSKETNIDDRLQTVLINRTKQDSLGWAFPGGLVESNETVDEAAIRELREETGVGSAEVIVEVWLLHIILSHALPLLFRSLSLSF